MKFKGHSMKAIFTITCLFVYASVFCQLPNSLTGNWINQETNNWEFGFFEQFAIYQSDFWDYGSISTKNGKTTIELQKDKQKIQLIVSQSNDSTLSISNGKQKAQVYSLMRKRYPSYKQPDHTPFSKPAFRYDSVTIVGYYRNYDKVPEEFKKNYGTNPFSVRVSNIILDEKDFYADIDSIGRFRLKFPVMNTQQVYADWQRLTQVLVMSPGDHLFLFADMNDLVADFKSMDDVIEFWRRDKQILFMGDNARLNNEIQSYRSPILFIDRGKFAKESSTDMEYLRKCETVYNQRMDSLKEHIVNTPFVSKKFRDYESWWEKYQFANNLMQHRFNLYQKAKEHFDPGYMEYVKSNFPLDNEYVYTMINEFDSYLTDYTGYYQGRSISMDWSYEQMIDEIEKRGEMTKELRDLFIAYREVYKKMMNSSDEQQLKDLSESNSRLFDSLNNNALMKELSDEWVRKSRFERNLRNIDSLITNKNLKEQLYAKAYYQLVEYGHAPLPDDQVKELKSRVTNPWFYKPVMDISDHYADVSKKGMAYEASLKNTSHLKESKNADSLFQQLIAPYKGKVIYLDVWGTWCGPCLEQIGYAGALKEALKGKDVVFMYLANSSPEEGWKNVIKEKGLTGENIVHYRLPDEQQDMVERKLSVRHYPTYLLINKQGEIVNTNPPRPSEKEAAVEAIEKLL